MVEVLLGKSLGIALHSSLFIFITQYDRRDKSAFLADSDADGFVWKSPGHGRNPIDK
jgi:hypothetical protein